MQNNYQPSENNPNQASSSSSITTGIVILIIGVIVLLKQFGMPIPSWIFSWKILLIGIGFVILLRNNFKGSSGFILILIGSIFLLRDQYILKLDSGIITAIAIIGIGIIIILNSVRKNYEIKTGKKAAQINRENLDSIYAETIFGSVTKNVISKNFEGGSLTSIFGAMTINLTQADMENDGIIDVTCVFGTIELIVPSNWKVNSDVKVIFGGVNDTRPILAISWEDETRILYLRGLCLFGGVEIKN